MNKAVYLAVLNFLLAWVCFRDVASAAILHRPLNMAVRTGESFVMNCRWESSNSSTEDSIEWYHTPVGGSSTEHKINDEYRIVNAIFNGTTLNGDIIGQRLMVPSAQKQHAGTYTCTQMVRDRYGSVSVETALAQLVVLASNPVCEMRSSSTQQENGVFDIECILSYTGSLAPVMRWSLANGNDKSKERTLSVSPQTDGMSKFSIVADSSLHGCRFICETIFNVSSTVSDPKVADNIPSYNYTWKSSYVEVIYGPRNLSVVPAGDVFYPDDRLTCMANGNPNPSVVWLNLESKEVTVGPTLTIVDSMTRDQPYKFLCRATNPTTNQAQEIQIGFAVKQRCTNSDSRFLKILLVVTLAVSAVIIASLSVYIAVTKRKRWGNSRAFPIASEGAFDAVNTKTPLSRATRHNLSLPLPTVKHPPFDYTDYLSPRPRPPSVDYDEIPDALAATAQNVVYLDFEPETTDQPASECSRHLNEYLESSEALAKNKVYETLKHRDN